MSEMRDPGLDLDEGGIKATKDETGTTASIGIRSVRNSVKLPECDNCTTAR